MVVLIGFLLPWFSIDVGKELSRVMSDGSRISGVKWPDPITGVMAEVKTGTLSVSGAEVQKGLGWLVLLCGGIAAGLAAAPQLIDDAQLRRVLGIGALVLGGGILFYLLSGSIRHVSYGFVLVVVGYFCIGVGMAETLRRAGRLQQSLV